MSVIEEALHTRLTTGGHAGIAALVGTRVYPQLADENATLPFLVFQRISGPRVPDLAGPTGLAQPRFQVDAYSESYLTAKNVATQVRLALDGYSATVDGVMIHGVTFVDERDLFESATDPKLHRVSMDFRVSHDEALS